MRAPLYAHLVSGINISTMTDRLLMVQRRLLAAGLSECRCNGEQFDKRITRKPTTQTRCFPRPESSHIIDLPDPPCLFPVLKSLRLGYGITSKQDGVRLWSLQERSTETRQ